MQLLLLRNCLIKLSLEKTILYGFHLRLRNEKSLASLDETALFGTGFHPELTGREEDNKGVKILAYWQELWDIICQ